MANHGGDMFIKALQDRFACKRYDPDGHISDSDFNTILEAARLSPSSFGMEPWKLLVVENKELLQQLLGCSWGAKKDADRTVILLARKNLTAQSDWAHNICHNVQHLSPQDEKARLEMFQTFQRRDLRVLELSPQTIDSKRAIFDWTSKQTYIALANMLSAAAVMGIDATPIEGCTFPKLESILVDRGIIDTAEWGVSVLVQFGVHDPSHRPHPKLRRPFAQVVEHLR